jgi:hypothetical protein
VEYVTPLFSPAFGHGFLSIFALATDRAGKAVVKTKRAIGYRNCMIGVGSIATAI